ncbi:MAG: catalase family protein [Planctomycetota bacterium]|jgi:catalase
MSVSQAEEIPIDEAAQISRLVDLNLALLDEKQRPTRRGQHPKQHGCVHASFTIQDNLDSELRHGLFAKPGVYPAAIRFSNGAATDDRKGDAHGMAIKLFKVPGVKLVGEGDTHDFVLIDHPVFFSASVAGFVDVFEALVKAKRSLLPKLAFFLPRAVAERGYVYLSHMHNRPVEMEIINKMISKRPSTPLGIRYWSATPYQLGPLVVKWSVRPQLNMLKPFFSKNSADKLRVALVDQLESGEAAFDFMVQVQTQRHEMPVENPTIEWDGDRAPWRKVATINISSQKPDTPALLEFCEHLAFNPWRCLPEHRPLGGINRARKAIYASLSSRRHVLNQVHGTEPSFTAFQALWTV